MIKLLSFTAFSVITHRYKIEYGNHNSRFIQWVIYELRVNFYLGVVRTKVSPLIELVTNCESNILNDLGFIPTFQDVGNNLVWFKFCLSLPPDHLFCGENAHYQWPQFKSHLIYWADRYTEKLCRKYMTVTYSSNGFSEIFCSKLFWYSLMIYQFQSASHSEIGMHMLSSSGNRGSKNYIELWSSVLDPEVKRFSKKLMVLTFVTCVTLVTNASVLDHTTVSSGIARCTSLIFTTALLRTILAVCPMFMFWAKLLKLI